jgi:anti-sigma factor RsiW
VRLGHGRWRRDAALHASGALGGPERAALLAHLERCPRCAREVAQMRAALESVAQDPLRGATPPIPVGALLTRVQARLDEARPARTAWTAWRPAWVGAGLAAVALAALLGREVVRPRGARELSPPPPPSTPVAGETSSVPPETWNRLEHTLERERAARYLTQAGDVLVTVASAPQRCTRRAHAVEVGEEAERSRELLAQRRLFVEPDAASVVAARDVLDDVEEMLRQVAALDPCARPQDLEAIRGEIARRHLLMKIDLMTRELQG